MSYEIGFDKSFDRLITNEGGYVNHPRDPGGETKFGISKRTYPNVDIKNLTREQAKVIYWDDFWRAGSMSQFHAAIAFQAFDAAVNHGIGNAIRMLQKAAGVADDGHIGPVTVNAVNAKSVTDMLMLFIAYRIRFWTKLSTWESFGKGWANRAAENLIFAAEDS
jgi:lysozyme family protein